MDLLCTGCVVQGGKDVPPVTGDGPIAVNPVTQEVTLDTTRVPDVPDCPEGATVRRAAGGGWECVVPFRSRVTNGAGQSVEPLTATALTYDTEETDVGEMHDGAQPRRIAIPAGGGGTYLIFGDAGFSQSPTGSGNYRQAVIKVNGVQFAIHRHRPTEIESDLVQVARIAELAAGDYVELVVLHDGAAAINVAGALSVARIR